MKSRNFADSFKNAMGTVFLLAGAFFVCSTLVSIRAVFADPIAPVVQVAPSAQSPRTTNSRRANASSTVNRATSATSVNSGRSVRANASRAVSARTATTTASRAAVAPTTASRANASRGTATRGAATRATRSTRVVPTSNANASREIVARGTTRNVVSRAGTTPTTRTAVATRNVRSRAAVVSDTDARVSLQGSAIRGSKRSNGTSSYTYLSNKLYTGDYSNIIDSSTGLISADAYSNCLESYYTCMDEICTARNASQGRCACANRTKAFRAAEEALEAANEELITVSGELALLVATKGKDVSKAFQLTDAERIMNCAAYAEIIASGTDAEINEWCSEHVEYTGTGNDVKIEKCTKSKAPTYCETMGAEYDFSLSDLGGTSSDILASLRSWADAKDSANNMLINDNSNLATQFLEEMDIVTGFELGNATSDDDVDLDDLANTWGYDLFEYAHNNVCSRVLDSCFNGIYEACGTPPNGGRCATSATTSCPYNYNSKIDVSDAGEVELIERGVSNAGTSSASCFGYSTTTDPYSHLRGPVADARRSVMQKYLLDANAACDVYGEQLRTTAQNVGYQKVAAQQALQQKRLEFAQEEEETILADAIEAGTNFDECLSEIIDCYENVRDDNTTWSDARIKTYCAQIAEVPSCYETMICNPSTAQFRAIIDVADNSSCFNSQDYNYNTCRNIVTISEILNGIGGISGQLISAGGYGSSTAMREQCLLDAGVADIRDWFDTTLSGDEKACTAAEIRSADPNGRAGYKTKDSDTCYLTVCNSGYTLKCTSDNCTCVENKYDCTSTIPYATKAEAAVNSDGKLTECVLQSCQTNFRKDGNKCEPIDDEPCNDELLDAWHASSGVMEWLPDSKQWSGCRITDCESGYALVEADNKCIESTRSCTATNADTASQEYNEDTQTWGECVIKACKTGYRLSAGKCVAEATE